MKDTPNISFIGKKNRLKNRMSSIIPLLLSKIISICFYLNRKSSRKKITLHGNFFLISRSWHSEGLAFSIFFHVLIEFLRSWHLVYSSLFPFVVTRGLKGAVIAWVCSPTPPFLPETPSLACWQIYTKHLQDGQGFRSVLSFQLFLPWCLVPRRQ